MSYKDVECQLLLLNRKIHYKKYDITVDLLREQLMNHKINLESKLEFNEKSEGNCNHSICDEYRNKITGVATLLYYGGTENGVYILGKECCGKKENMYNLFGGYVDNHKCYLLEAYRELKEESKFFGDFKFFLQHIKYYNTHYDSLIIYLDGSNFMINEYPNNASYFDYMNGDVKEYYKYYHVTKKKKLATELKYAEMIELKEFKFKDINKEKINEENGITSYANSIVRKLINKELHDFIL